jgi:hypothetical protein
MEKVWGPVDGFYIAAYSIPVADGERFCSYAKVCMERPQSYWDANCLFKLFAGEHHGSEIAALACAHMAAQSQIERIPSRERALLGFAMFNTNHDVVFPLADQIRHRHQRAAA